MKYYHKKENRELTEAEVRKMVKENWHDTAHYLVRTETDDGKYKYNGVILLSMIDWSEDKDYPQFFFDTTDFSEFAITMDWYERDYYPWFNDLNFQSDGTCVCEVSNVLGIALEAIDTVCKEINPNVQNIV